MIQLDHVADFYRRYPGEILTLHTRITVSDTVTGLFYFTVMLPAGLIPLEYGYQAPDPPSVPPESGGKEGGLGGVPRMELDTETDAIRLIWKYEGEFTAGSRYDYQVQVKVAPTREDWVDETQAKWVGYAGETKLFEVVASAPLEVLAKAKILKYLPSIYQDDELLGRYLMFFESFWQPFEDRIKHMPYYFDPKMTPPDFLPWLSSWVSLLVDERLPEARQRDLIREAVALYLRRGTRSALQKRSQICLGVPPDEADDYIQIEENKAGNLQLHDDTLLGDALTLGTSDDIYKFTVTITWPPQTERLARETIAAIIEAEKPAHTDYQLRIIEVGSRR